MNKLLSVLSFILGAVALAAIFSQDSTVWLIVASSALLFSLLGFWVQSYLSQKGNNFVNRIFYHITRSRDYDVLKNRVTYEYISQNQMKFTKKILIKASKAHISSFEGRYIWSGEGKQPQITVIKKGQNVRILKDEQLWSIYSVDFGTNLDKGEEIETGVVIDNLVDEINKAKPFISSNISKKTKFLELTAKIPTNLKPKNAIFTICDNRDASSALVKEELEYNYIIGGFQKQIEYPRYGWSYTITWEFETMDVS